MKVICSLLASGAADRAQSLAEACLAFSPQIAIGVGAVFVEIEASRHLFDRVAIRSGDSFNVSGRALRLLAGLRDRRPRDIVMSLPKKDMNHEH